MKRKPLEKLSDRFERLWLTHVKQYDLRYFYQENKTNVPSINEWTPLHFAKYMTTICMDMIAEYKPEDIK